MTDVTAWGEVLIDFTCTGADAEGYPALQAHPGGAPANFLAPAARYGGRTELIARVGADIFGDRLEETLRRAGIGVRGLGRDPERFTTLAFVTLDGRGEREFSFARKPGADTGLTFGPGEEDILRASRVFHFGTLSLTEEPAAGATRRAVAFARSQGAFITCDPNLRLPLWDSPERARRAMEWAVQQADGVKVSGEEGRFLFGTGPEETAQRLLSAGARLAFVTLGAQGCLACTCREQVSVPGFPAQAVDTTGAGDIFFGSAVWRWLSLKKEPEDLTEPQLRDIARFACAAAALSVARPGGLSSVPELQDVEALLRRYP